ncbi:hypothetical protein Nepgr_006594 [Nepenthes gracilis]|uniref:Uncharacterized protein n=1 Tax=Nepenthes gracilis TaxID=150966 RepID=A0AAD3XHI1_NEPGR|nr:hypothetical protein Nepgr_006594 [Nepenthes gracilis]
MGPTTIPATDSFCYTTPVLSSHAEESRGHAVATTAMQTQLKQGGCNIPSVPPVPTRSQPSAPSGSASDHHTLTPTRATQQKEQHKCQPNLILIPYNTS